jgi:hypothetical protein
MSGVARRAWRLAVMTLVGCMSVNSPPPPTPVSLSIPPPPDPRPGAIVIYPSSLPEARAAEIGETFRAAETKVLSVYQQELADDVTMRNSALAEGTLQVRIGINREGKVASVTRVYSELNEQMGGRVSTALRKVTVSPGPEAWVYQTFRFESGEPFEVLRISTDFGGEQPAILALVENRSTFHIPAVRATVTVLGPDKSKALRVYRRRVRDSFAPGERQELRIPIGGEWATTRNSFVVAVRPLLGDAGAEEN